MSQLSQLIEEQCPDGVEYRTLSDVGELTRGRRFTKADYVEAGLGSIHYGEVYTSYGTAAHKVLSFVRSDLKSKLRLAHRGDLVIAATGESVDEVGKAVAWLGDDEVAVHDDCYILRHNLDPEYVAYYFQSRSFHEQKTKFVTESKLARISAAGLASIRVPTPPLEVQRAVVDILSKMEQLDAELKAELKARTRQYSHYRDFLMAGLAHSEVQKRRFGDVATIVRGASPRPIQVFLTASDDGVNWIKIGDVPATGKYVTRTAQRITQEGALRSRRVQPGDFILSNSMSFGRPYIAQIDGFIHDGWLAIKDFDEHLDRDFLYHLLRSSTLYAEMASRAGSGTVKNLNADIVKSLELPVPPLARQRSIAQALDKFDALVNDPSSGLPAEVAARRKQFEYYRDLLLTFPEKKTAT